MMGRELNQSLNAMRTTDVVETVSKPLRTFPLGFASSKHGTTAVKFHCMTATPLWRANSHILPDNRDGLRRCEMGKAL